MGLGLATLYALASGATLFAMEREAETYEFLRALPVKPLAVLAGKIVFALSSTAIQFLLAWTLALALAGGLPDRLFHREIWAICGLGGLELLAWGILFSLLLRRTLVAVICAVTVASATLWILAHLLIFGGGSNQLQADLNFKTAVGGLLILAFLTVADIGLAAQLVPRKAVRARAFAKLRVQGSKQFGFCGPFRFRHARPACLAGVAAIGRHVGGPDRHAASHGLVHFVRPPLNRIDPEKTGWSYPALLLATLFSAPLLGSSVFLADQTGCRFRFLAEHGFPSRLVWLSRQIPRLARHAAGVVADVVVFDRSNRIGKTSARARGCADYRGRGRVRTRRLRVRAALLDGNPQRTPGRDFWHDPDDGTLHLGGNHVHALLELAVVGGPALVGIRDRYLVARAELARGAKELGERLRLALVIAVPVLAILVAVPLVRVYEIPLVGPGFDVGELTRPVTAEDEETLALYRRAFNLYETRRARLDRVGPHLVCRRRVDPSEGERASGGHGPGGQPSAAAGRPPRTGWGIRRDTRNMSWAAWFSKVRNVCSPKENSMRPWIATWPPCGSRLPCVDKTGTAAIIKWRSALVSNSRAGRRKADRRRSGCSQGSEPLSSNGGIRLRIAASLNRDISNTIALS